MSYTGTKAADIYGTNEGESKEKPFNNTNKKSNKPEKTNKPEKISKAAELTSLADNTNKAEATKILDSIKKAVIEECEKKAKQGNYAFSINCVTDVRYIKLFEPSNFKNYLREQFKKTLEEEGFEVKYFEGDYKSEENFEIRFDKGREIK